MERVLQAIPGHQLERDCRCLSKWILTPVPQRWHKRCFHSSYATSSDKSSWTCFSAKCSFNTRLPCDGTTRLSSAISSKQPGTHSSGGRTHQDEVRKDRSPIPNCDQRRGLYLLDTPDEWVDPKDHHCAEHLVSGCSVLLGPGCLARQQHNWWLSLSAAERATHLGLPTTGQTIPLQFPPLKATMQTESVITSAMQKGTTTILDLLCLTFQTHLPSEPSARVDGLTAIEAPLRAARHFQDALSTLLAWRQQVLAVVTDLGGNPEPLKLPSSLKTLISSLVSSDSAFATEVAQTYCTTNVKVHCTDSALLQMMGLLEIELSARAQEDDKEKRRKGQTHHASSASAEARGASKGKAKGKGKPPQPPNKGEGKKDDNKGKGKGGGELEDAFVVAQLAINHPCHT